MRGKLRDKRATTKQDKSGAFERKRGAKHTTSLAPWLNPETDEQDDELLETEAGMETVITVLPQPEKK